MQPSRVREFVHVFDICSMPDKALIFSRVCIVISFRCSRLGSYYRIFQPTLKMCLKSRQKSAHIMNNRYKMTYQFLQTNKKNYFSKKRKMRLYTRMKQTILLIWYVMFSFCMNHTSEDVKK